MRSISTATSCDTCASTFVAAFPWCPHCRSTRLSSVELGGQGVVYSHTTVWMGDRRTLAYIDLDEGLRVLGRISTGVERLHCGARVRLLDGITDGAGAVDPRLAEFAVATASDDDDASPIPSRSGRDA